MIRNIFGVILGIVFGTITNSLLINIGPNVIALPPGADVSSFEALAATIDLFEPRNFIFPFLAHALGTLIGVFVAMKIVVSHKFPITIGLSIFFLIGGILAVIMLPKAPLWFDVIDLVFAYIPMAWIGSKLAGSGK